jgi:hypothetical protein
MGITVRPGKAAPPVRLKCRTPINSRLLLHRYVALPDVFHSLGQGLPFCSAVGMAGVAGEDELVVIALSGKHAGHVFIGVYPVVHTVPDRRRFALHFVGGANRQGPEVLRGYAARRGFSAGCSRGALKIARDRLNISIHATSTGHEAS